MSIRKFLIALLALVPSLLWAQDQGNYVMYEETEVHISYPEMRVFVTPQICDLKMVNESNPRQEFETSFNLTKSIDNLTGAELENFKRRAMYQFAAEEDADVIIEPIFDTKVYGNNTKQLRIFITGYPAKYVNFRPLKGEDLETVKVVYPAEFQKVEK